MWLVKNNRTGKVYKTKYDLETDKLKHLYGRPFIKGGVMSVSETLSEVKCLDKFPFIEVLGKVDGRTKGAREHDWFTWLCVLD